MGVLSSEGLLFTLSPSSPSRFCRFRHQQFLRGNPCSEPRMWRSFTRKLSASSQSSGIIAGYGGWGDSRDGCEWEDLDDSNISRDMGILEDYLFFINKDKDVRVNITLFFLGFMSALAISRFKSSLLSIFPICVFLFVGGFCLGYVRHGSMEDAKAGNRKIFKSQGGVGSVSSHKIVNLGSILNNLDTMVSELENAMKGEKVSEFGTCIESIRLVKLAIESSVLHDSALALSDRHLDEDRIKEMYSYQKVSRRRSKQLPVDVNVIQFLIAIVKESFLGSKSSKANLFPLYGSPVHNGDLALELCKENLDDHAMTPEPGKVIQPSKIKVNSIGSKNGGIMRTEVEGNHSGQMHEKEQEGCNSGIIAQKQMFSTSRELLYGSDMSQNGQKGVTGTLHGGRSSSSQGPKDLNSVGSPDFVTSFPVSNTTYKDGKVLESLSRNFENHTINNDKIGDKHANELSAVRDQVQSYERPNSRSPGRNLSIGFYKEHKAAVQQEHYNHSRVHEALNLSNYRIKAKKAVVESETESLPLGYELNCRESSLESKDELYMENEGATGDSLSTMEEEKKFRESFDEGVLLLKEAKECFISQLDEEEVPRILTRSADLLSRAAEMKPTSVMAVGQWGNTLLLHGRLKLKISRKLRDVLSSNDPLFRQKNCREKIIFDLSDVCEECEQLLIEAGRKYRRALSIDNNDIRALYNWGLALFFRAQLIADIGPEAAYDADKVYLAAIDKFDAMLARSNAYATSALFRWGMILQQRSLLRPIGSKERSKLLLQAKRLFEDALAIDSDYSQAREALSFCIDELRY